MEGEFQFNTILTNLYIQTANFIFQVSILYERGNFLWIGQDNLPLKQKKFGDIPRAISKYEQF